MKRMSYKDRKLRSVLCTWFGAALFLAHGRRKTREQEKRMCFSGKQAARVIRRKRMKLGGNGEGLLLFIPRRRWRERNRRRKHPLVPWERRGMKGSRRARSEKERIRARVSLRDGNASGRSYGGFRGNAGAARLRSTKYIVGKSFRQMFPFTYNEFVRWIHI